MVGGVPRIIALVGADPTKGDILPRGRSYLFDIELLEGKNLLRINDAPSGEGDFFDRVTLGESCSSLERIHDLLTLNNYR